MTSPPPLASVKKGAARQKEMSFRHKCNQFTSECSRDPGKCTVLLLVNSAAVYSWLHTATIIVIVITIVIIITITIVKVEIESLQSLRLLGLAP